MKREIKATREKRVKSPPASRTAEREFGESMEYMIDQMARQFKNQVLLAMNKSTVSKFADAQTGNFAKSYSKLANRARRKIYKRFSADRIRDLSNKYTSGVDRKNSQEFYNAIQGAVGISAKELESTEGLNATINAYKLETSQWAQKVRDDTMTEWINVTLRRMAEGDTLEQILANFDDMTEKRKGHARMVARTQITTFNSLAAKARARNLGITKAKWVTARDERVRPCHRARDGKEFDLAEGLYASCDGKTLLPGADYNCRCDYEFVITQE